MIANAPLSRGWRLFGLVIFVGLSSYYFVVWRSARAQLTDFPPMYGGARLMQAGEQVYDINAQCREQARIRSDLCMPFNHSPVLLPLISLISTEDYVASFKRWCLILALVIWLCVIPAYVLSKDLDASLQLTIFVPLLISVTQGQDTAFLFLAVITWAALLKANRDFCAGLVLSMGVVKPHILLLLALPLAFSRTRAFLGFCVGGLMAVLISLYLVGISGLTGLMEITRISATGTTFGVHHADMYSAVGLFARAGLSPYWAWAVFIIALVATSILWKKHPKSIHAFCMGIIATVFAAPHLLMHDFAIVAIAIYLIHPFATVAASLLLLTLYGFGAPYLGGYLLMIVTALFHWNRLYRETTQAVSTQSIESVQST